MDWNDSGPAGECESVSAVAPPAVRLQRGSYLARSSGRYQKGETPRLCLVDRYARILESGLCADASFSATEHSWLRGITRPLDPPQRDQFPGPAHGDALTQNQIRNPQSPPPSIPRACSSASPWLWSWSCEDSLSSSLSSSVATRTSPFQEMIPLTAGSYRHPKHCSHWRMSGVLSLASVCNGPPSTAPRPMCSRSAT